MKRIDLLRNAFHASLQRFDVDLNRIPSDRWLRQMPVQTVIDVGANMGQFARIARRLFPTSQIYSFEPLEDCLSAMQIAFKNDSLWRGYQYALGADEGEALFHRSTTTGSSSLLTMTDLHKDAFPASSGDRPERVQIRRLDEVLKEVDLTADLLLKLDVQGFEDRVLDGATQVLAKTEVLITEVSFERLYDGQAAFEDIYDRLRHAGFNFHGAYSQLLHPNGRVLQADAIFLRD